MADYDYRNKVYGGWMGKNIGGTLGGPLEGKKEVLTYDFYPKLAGLPLANDDLDLQLVWLHALELYGPRLTAVELAREWQDHVFFPYDEYGYSLTNMRMGLQPPVSGWFGNPFTNCMGSPIRSEIWAMVTPGQPELAAYYAYQDAITDHAGGEGVYGEMFFAAIESAAFVESDRDRLIETGLRVIPPDCRTARAVRDTVAWHKAGLDWVENRARILAAHGRANFTDAPQNIAFTILGWLYGEDFGDAICKAVNCGYDTDCTGATLGAILGIIMGADKLPAKWTAPLGEAVVVSPPVKGFAAPKTIAELTERTARVQAEVAAFWAHRAIPAPSELWHLRPQENRYCLPAGSHIDPSLEVAVIYGEEGPAVFPNRNAAFTVELTNRSSVRWAGSLALELPGGWTGDQARSYVLEPGERQTFPLSILPTGAPQPVYSGNLYITRLHNGDLWQAYRVPLAFPLAMRWRVAGPGVSTELFSIGARLPVEKLGAEAQPGIYTFSTNITSPVERYGRLVVGTAAPVRVTVDGNLVLDDWRSVEFLPAYHRGRGVFTTVPAGTHQLAVEVEKAADQPLELCIAFVGPRQVAEPGALYGQIDLMFT